MDGSAERHAEGMAEVLPRQQQHHPTQHTPPRGGSAERHAEWLWSSHLVDELRQRGMADAAMALGDRQVATRYKGPAVADLGDAELLALAHRFVGDTRCLDGSVAAAT